MHKDHDLRIESHDIVVIGGGVAGVVAAIAAARRGCRVGLVQDRPVLGGNSSNEVRVTVSGAESIGTHRNARETGILEELRLEYARRVHSPRANGEPRPLWDWLLWEWVTREPGIALHLNCRALRPTMRSPEEIASIVVSQPAAEQEWEMRARLFIDCSGDGTIAALAGAGYLWGREGRGEFDESRARDEGDDFVLCPTLMFSARNVGQPVSFTPPPWARRFPKDDDLPLRPHPIVDSGYWWIEYGGTLDPIRDAERIRDELTAIVLGVWDHLKNHGDHGAGNYELDWVGSVLGKRESRRFIGDTVLTQRDVEGQRVFGDAVAYAGWALDHLHPPEGIESLDPPGNLPQRLYLEAKHSRWFPYGTIVKALYRDPPAHWPDILPPLAGLCSIPFGSLYSRDVRNLLIAGRHISATHIAFGSTRLQATTAIMGQAVGTAAALCLEHDVDPRTLRSSHIRDLQQQLLRDDCYIPHTPNSDPGDLLRDAQARASSDASLEITDTDVWLPLDVGRGQMICLSGPQMHSVSLLVRSDSDVPRTMRASLMRASRLGDFSSEVRVANASAVVGANSTGWVDLAFSAPIERDFPYWIRVEPTEKVSWASTMREVIGAPRAEWYEILDRWQPVRGSHAFRISPQARPYGPGNVVSGVSRPEVGTNMWMSNGAESLPQWIELQLPKSVPLGTICLTFDTNLSDLVDTGPAPECVCDYHLEVGDGGEFQEVACVRGNYQRRCVHRFAVRSASRVRLTVEATNGSREARVYEIRGYGEGE